jgi:hypothetical protein
VKTTRVCLFLIVAFLCVPTIGLAQSNAKPDYSHAHKNAEKYQKHLQKQQRKQEKAQVKRQQALIKQQKQRATNP